jgi:hypothetical protein
MLLKGNGKKISDSGKVKFVKNIPIASMEQHYADQKPSKSPTEKRFIKMRERKYSET